MASGRIDEVIDTRRQSKLLEFILIYVLPSISFQGSETDLQELQ